MATIGREGKMFLPFCIRESQVAYWKTEQDSNKTAERRVISAAINNNDCVLFGLCPFFSPTIIAKTLVYSHLCDLHHFQLASPSHHWACVLHLPISSPVMPLKIAMLLWFPLYWGQLVAFTSSSSLVNVSEIRRLFYVLCYTLGICGGFLKTRTVSQIFYFQYSHSLKWP